MPEDPTDAKTSDDHSEVRDVSGLMKAVLLIKTGLFKVVLFLPTALRLLLGFILMSTGWRWIHRPEAIEHLTGTLTFLLTNDQPIGFCAMFLTSVVLPNVAIFTFLVSWGEFLSGISLFFGLGSRLGAAVASFQMLNYGLMGGPKSLVGHAIFIGLLAITVFWGSGRKFGVDRWLYPRWPRAKIW